MAGELKARVLEPLLGGPEFSTLRDILVAVGEVLDHGQTCCVVDLFNSIIKVKVRNTSTRLFHFHLQLIY
jgi:hypothetical protein